MDGQVLSDGTGITHSLFKEPVQEEGEETKEPKTSLYIP